MEPYMIEFIGNIIMMGARMFLYYKVITLFFNKLFPF